MYPPLSRLLAFSALSLLLAAGPVQARTLKNLNVQAPTRSVLDAQDIVSRVMQRLQDRQRISSEPSQPSPQSSSQATSRPRSSGQASSAPTVAPTSLKQQLVDLVNEERRKAGVPALRYNNLLANAAQAHAQDMRAKDYFEHNSLDGRTPTQRMQEAGYRPNGCRCSYAYGENIAMGQRSGEEAMRDWMNSPGHKRNILSRDFDEIGIGIDGYYWVQDFGSIRGR